MEAAEMKLLKCIKEGITRAGRAKEGTKCVCRTKSGYSFWRGSAVSYFQNQTGIGM